MPSTAADCSVPSHLQGIKSRVANDHTSHNLSMAETYLPIYTITSFYLRIVLILLGIIVVGTAASSLNLFFKFYFRGGTYRWGREQYPNGEVRFAIFSGAFTILFAGAINITLSFFSRGLMVAIITAIDILAAGFSLGSGICGARVGGYVNVGTINAFCAFSFLSMIVAITVLAFDTRELLELRQHGALANSQREHQMTVAALKSSLFISHSTVADPEDRPANPNSTTLDHAESAAEPVVTRPNVDGYVDTIAPTGIPNEAQPEPKPKDRPVNPNSTVLEHTELSAESEGTKRNVDGYVDTTAPEGVPDEAQYEPKPAV